MFFLTKSIFDLVRKNIDNFEFLNFSKKISTFFWKYFVDQKKIKICDEIILKSIYTTRRIVFKRFQGDSGNINSPILVNCDFQKKCAFFVLKDISTPPIWRICC